MWSGIVGKVHGYSLHYNQLVHKFIRLGMHAKWSVVFCFHIPHHVHSYVFGMKVCIKLLYCIASIIL